MNWTELPDDSYFERARDVSVFNRASLLLTFDLLRNTSPRLALEVRNITGTEPLPQDATADAPGEEHDRNGDNFRVELNLDKVRFIVQELMEFTKPERIDIKNPEINIMARALMQDWLILAHHLISSEPLNMDLVESNKPPPPN